MPVFKSCVRLNVLNKRHRLRIHISSMMLTAMHCHLVLKLELDAPVALTIFRVLAMAKSPIWTGIGDLAVWPLTGQRVPGFGIAREPQRLSANADRLVNEMHMHLSKPPWGTLMTRMLMHPAP